MVVATPYNYGDIATDFNYAEQFKLYKIKDGSIVTTDLVLTNGSGYVRFYSFIRISAVSANILYIELVQHFFCRSLKRPTNKHVYV